MLRGKGVVEYLLVPNSGNYKAIIIDGVNISMGHYANVYGYLLVSQYQRKDVDCYVEQYRSEGKVFSEIIFGPNRKADSGFFTYAIAGEIKESYYNEPEDMNALLLEFLEPIEGTYCLIGFDSELGRHPE